jgi:hypothetical protein
VLSSLPHSKIDLQFYEELLCNVNINAAQEGEAVFFDSYTLSEC